MPLLSPPKEFVKQLQQYDHHLRVRWSDRDQEWRIERKISRGRWISPSAYNDHETEDFYSARDGYVLAFTARQNQLDDRILFTLWATDLQRRGGAQAVADEIEQKEEQARLASRNRFLDDLYMMAIERWNHANMLTRTKMTLHPDRKDEHGR